MKTFIGIDPGISGGIAEIRTFDGGIPDVIQAHPMPPTEKDVFSLIYGIQLESEQCFALLEFVASSPQMGVKSAFTFGQGWGALRMGLVSTMIPFETVTPTVWQRGMKCLTRGDKNVSKRRAQELFPKLKITHKTADALLIAEWCRRTKGGEA